jgi:hypothetical protein
MNKPLFKLLALLNFIVLGTLFILLQDGKWLSFGKVDTAIQLTSPNGGTLAKNSRDTLAVKRDSLQIQMLPTPTNSIPQAKPDSLTQEKAAVERRQQPLMQSSKSGILIHTTTVGPISTEKESKKKKEKKEKQQ